MKKDKKKKELENPEDIIDEVVSDLDTIHQSLVDTTTQVGFIKDGLKEIRPIWRSLTKVASIDPEVAPTYSSSVQFLKAYRDEIASKRNLFLYQSEVIVDVTCSGASLINSTASTVAFTNSREINSGKYLSLPTSPNQYEINVIKFSQFDQSLGKTYKEIWESLYGTRADPERSALFLIRQAFDHLFHKLAPDEEVRKSIFWKKKKDKTNQIFRQERIKFAVNKHIKNDARAKTLLASMNNMLDIYQNLNTAHKRGELNTFRARRALEQMRTVLEEWINAINE